MNGAFCARRETRGEEKLYFSPALVSRFVQNPAFASLGSQSACCAGYRMRVDRSCIRKEKVAIILKLFISNQKEYQQLLYLLTAFFEIKDSDRELFQP